MTDTPFRQEQFTVYLHLHLRDVFVNTLTDLREVVLLVPGGGDLEDVPLDGEVELGQVDPDVDDVRPTNLVHVLQVQLEMEVSGQSVQLVSDDETLDHNYTKMSTRSQKRCIIFGRQFPRGQHSPF